MAWAPGEHIVLREIYLGRIWAARPVVVVRDSPDVMAFWTPPGTRWQVPTTREGARLDLQPDDWVLREVPFTLGTLRLAEPGVGHSVCVFWEGEEFLAWYVNLEEPLRRAPLGFDYLDQKLDLIIHPDGLWEWKDEDHLAEAVRRGIVAADQASAIRREGERVLERYRAKDSPFSDGWERWRPDPAWTTPVLPDGWDRAPR
ncbi:MAG: DUF402 domain-containing protein [Acidobacteria bacterium]|nr:DUF402 domain-containing protein [Acidobacteriota bacterium]